MNRDKYEADVFGYALLIGLPPDRVVASLTGDEDCTPLEFVEQWADKLDRDNARAQEDYEAQL